MAGRDSLLRWEQFTDAEVRALFTMTDLIHDHELVHGPRPDQERELLREIEDEWEVRVRRMSDDRPPA